MRIFLIFTLITSLCVLGIVAFTGLQIRESEGTSLLSSVQEAAKMGEIQWNEFTLESDKGDTAAYIRVHQPSGKMLESRGTTEFLTEKSPIWGYFSFAHNDIFWYTSQTAHGSRGEMWLNINIVIEAMAQAILALVFLMLVLFFGARSWIKKSANSISQPLSDLALAADELEEPQLPMAKKPEEVRQLTKSFNGLLERLNRKIEQEQQFVSDASHELRTPLAAIRGHVTLLKRRWHEHPEIVDDSLSYIDEESMRMKRLIEELLLISRGTHLKRDEECFDLNEFTDRTVREIQPALTQQVSFERGQALMITSDKNALHHILIAFLENAGKYAPADTKISVALTQNEDEIDLTITDEGPGIPDDEKEKVFERFYRVDKSRSSEIPGTGLGLSIAKQYAELNKAEAFVTDNQPKGSIFHLKLKK